MRASSARRRRELALSGGEGGTGSHQGAARLAQVALALGESLGQLRSAVGEAVGGSGWDDEREGHDGDDREREGRHGQPGVDPLPCSRGEAGQPASNPAQHPAQPASTVTAGHPAPALDALMDVRTNRNYSHFPSR